MMQLLLIRPGRAYEVVLAKALPPIGSRIDGASTYAPEVKSILMWPSYETLSHFDPDLPERLGLEETKIEAIIYVE